MNTPNPYAPPQAAVADMPVPGTPAKADRSTRLAAAMVDWVVSSIMITGPLLVGAGMAGAFNLYNAQSNPLAFFMTLIATGGLFALAGLAVWGTITFVLVKRNGQTIAKKWLNIKVVRADGTPASVGRIFWLRNVVNRILRIIPFYFLIDCLWIFGEESRCVHDKIADTMVVKA